MSRVLSQAGTHSHSVLTQRSPLVMPRSVRKASAYRGSTCIDGAARKNDHRMMLRESDIPPYMDHRIHLHTRNLRHMERRARPDASCVTVRLRSSMCTASAVRALLCHAAPSRHAMAQPVRVEQASVCQPSLTCSPSERSLRSSAPACPKAKVAAAIAIAAGGTCAGPPRPAARTRATVESPAGAKSIMRVTVEC